MTKVGVLISNLDRSGPCLGAVAFSQLCNVNKFDVELLTRKNYLLGKDLNNVKVSSLDTYFRIWKKLNFESNFSEIISFDLKMDLLNVLSKGKTVIYIRADNKENYRDTFGFILGRILYYFHLILLMLAEEVWVLSNVIESKLDLYLIRNKIHVIPNFISYPPSCEIKKIQNSFLVVSSIIKRKRVLSIVKSFLNIYRYNSSASLTIIGQGYLENNLNLLLDSEEFTCSINFINESIQPKEYFLESEYFILMSSSEGLSRAALEASNYGCKLILSDIPVHREYFLDYAVLALNFDILTDIFKKLNDGSLILRPAFPLKCAQSYVLSKIRNRLKSY